jgi:hypothetical protein
MAGVLRAAERQEAARPGRKPLQQHPQQVQEVLAQLSEPAQWPPHLGPEEAHDGTRFVLFISQVDEAILHDFFNEDPFPVEPQDIRSLKHLPDIAKPAKSP